MNENLNWKYHLSELLKKLARACGIFLKFNLLPTDVLVSLHNSLFASFLQYGIIVWGLTYEIHIKPIYTLQKKVVRAIAFMNFTSSSSPIFSDLKSLKLYDLFRLKLLLFVYESVNKISPSVFHNVFEILSHAHQHDKRQARKGDIFMRRHNTLQYGERYIRYTGAKSWNNIIKQSPSVMSFRGQLKLHLFSTNYQVLVFSCFLHQSISKCLRYFKLNHRFLTKGVLSPRLVYLLRELLL